MKTAKVYVKGPAYESLTKRVFENDTKKKYEIVSRIQDCDICVWTGGEDISPSIYGEKPIKYGAMGYSKFRDRADLEAIDIAFNDGKFLVGICRGAQLLNCVPNGGTLWQDVDRHGGHHKVFDCLSGEYVTTNSVHHQAMRVTDDAEVIAWALESTSKFSEHDMWNRPADVTKIPEKEKDIEAVWYPKTRSLCVQFHPEFGHAETTQYFLGLMDVYYFSKQKPLEEAA